MSQCRLAAVTYVNLHASLVIELPHFPCSKLWYSFTCDESTREYLWGKEAVLDAARESFELIWLRFRAGRTDSLRYVARTCPEEDYRARCSGCQVPPVTPVGAGRTPTQHCGLGVACGVARPSVSAAPIARDVNKQQFCMKTHRGLSDDCSRGSRWVSRADPLLTLSFDTLCGCWSPAGRRKVCATPFHQNISQTHRCFDSKKYFACP